MERGDDEQRAMIAGGELVGLEYYRHLRFEGTTFDFDEEPSTYTEGAAMGAFVGGSEGGIRALWLASIGRFDEAKSIAEPLFQGLELSEAQLPYATDEQILRSGERGSGALAQTYAWLGRPDDGRFPSEYGISYNRAHGNAHLPYFINLDLHLRVLPYLTDDLVERQRLVGNCVEAAQLISAGQLTDHPSTQGAYAGELLGGRWGTAGQILDEAMRMGGAREPVHVACAYRARLARWQGDAGLAWSLVWEVLPSRSGTEPGTVGFHAAIVAQRVAIALALDSGDLQTARGWLEMHSHWLDWSGVVLGQAERRLLWARYRQQYQDVDRACQIAERALALASQPRQPLALIAARRLLGELETAGGNYARATRRLDASIELADTCAVPYEAALSRIAKAESLAAGGDVIRSRTLIPSVRETLLSMGAKPALSRLDRLETLLANSTETYPDGLTRREAEVLGLVGRGLSSRQIAELLFLRVRTVERHVSNIYQKIDADGRSEATAYALNHGLTDAPPT